MPRRVCCLSRILSFPCVGPDVAIRKRTGHVAFLACIACLSLAAFAVENSKSTAPTHKPAQSIRPTLDGAHPPLHTFALSPERELWLCCSSLTNNKQGWIIVTDLEGAFLRAHPLSFVPTAIGFQKRQGKTSSVFVAGSGKVAKLTPDGHATQTIDAPNVGDRDAVIEALKEAARREAAEIVVNVEKQKDRIKAQIEELEKTPEQESEEQQARRLRRLKMLSRQWTQMQKSVDSVMSGDAGVNEASLASLEYATGLAVSEDYLFVSLPSANGFGYDVWRMDHELGNAKAVLTGGKGCCGQYDIQTNGNQLVVAENCNFQVAFYDFEGAPIKRWGQRATRGGEGFGSCCNPMNVQCQGEEVLTAESSIGHIKRFTAEGELVAFIGTAPIGGGCKHVALAHDRISDRYFMFNEDRKCISVLVPKNWVTDETDEEKAARLAMEGMGKSLRGNWSIVKRTDGGTPLSNFLEMKFATLGFGDDGAITDATLTTSFSANKEMLIALTKVAGSSEAAQLLASPVVEAKWDAIEQSGSTLRIRFFEDGVSTLEADIQFPTADTMQVTYYYGAKTRVDEATYRRQRDE